MGACWWSALRQGRNSVSMQAPPPPTWMANKTGSSLTSSTTLISGKLIALVLIVLGGPTGYRTTGKLERRVPFFIALVRQAMFAVRQPEDRSAARRGRPEKPACALTNHPKC